MVEKMKNEISDRQNIFWFLIAAIVLSIGFYLYFLGHSVWSVVERQKAEKSVAGIESGIEKLETNYLNLKARVTTELAQSKGFTNVSSAIYISRKAIGKGLTLNNEI